MLFKNREEVARGLAEKLEKHRNSDDTFVVAIDRGGILIADIVATELDLPFNVTFVKEITHPANPNYIIGTTCLNAYKIDRAEYVTEDKLKNEVQKIQHLLKNRYKRFNGNLPSFNMKGKTLIFTDDGNTTGDSLSGMISIARKYNAKGIILAIPVTCRSNLQKFNRIADKVICLHSNEYYESAGQFYEKFDEVSDYQLAEILKKANKNM